MHCNDDQPNAIFNTEMFLSLSFYNRGNNRSELLNGKNQITAGHSTGHAWMSSSGYQQCIRE